MFTFINCIALLSFAATVTFLLWLVGSLGSKRITVLMHQYPVLHGVWALVSFLTLFVLFGGVSRTFWPPEWIERRGQRRMVHERIQSAGGWPALRRDCESLVKTTNVFFWWRNGERAKVPIPNPEPGQPKSYVTNLNSAPLPGSLAVLKPWHVDYIPPDLMKGSPEAPDTPVVRMKIFGMHSTGGHSQPYFGLEVACGPAAALYRPTSRGHGVAGNRYSRHRKVAEGIFEVY